MGSQPDTIMKITVRGFKSIADEQEIELRPLTLLAGANSSGKSSIMQPILLLKQTLEAPSDPGALLLDGPNVRFTMAEQLLSRVSKEPHKPEFMVQIGLSNGRSLEIVFKRTRSMGFALDSMNYVDKKGEASRIVPGMSQDQILAAEPLLHVERLLSQPFGRTDQTLSWAVRRERCFLCLALSGETNDSPPIAVVRIPPDGEFAQHLQRLLHLPGLRGNPRRTYPRNAGGSLFPGTFENYVASVVTQWQSTNDPRLSLLAASLEDMGLTWKVEAIPVDDTRVELRVGRLPYAGQGEEHDLVSIADVGVGMSQSLPVLVALIAAEPGQVVYLEQPEIHLHPRAQRRLAHVLADAANRGVIVVAETHSSLLLREIQTLVATSKLTTDKVKLHWFQRQDDGRTVVTPADLDENGAFGDWPEDFDEVELDAERAYLDAVERKGAGE
jgi:hypothetical protein